MPVNGLHVIRSVGDDPRMSSYPVGYEADFVAERSRLTTFFRYLLAIPVMIVAIVWMLLAYIAALLAWFAIMITGRYPGGLYNMAAGGVRFAGRMNGYLRLITDAYPPLDWGEHPEYPIRIPIAPPQAKYSRLKAFFRFLIGIPVILINYALNILGSVCALIAWFVIVITGKQSEGLQNALNLSNAYNTRATAYFLYVTETWPPFSSESSSPLGPVPPESVASS
jgi:hypothetical protein